MDHSQYLDGIRRDAAAIVGIARSTAPATAIASCPGWDLTDLTWHVGEVHDFWATIVRERLAHWDQYTQPDRPETHDGVVELAERSAAAMLAALSSTDPATEVWTWSNQHDVAFVIRRMAQETAVHRWDAELAAGNEWRVDAGLAADGIDEFLVHFLPDVVDREPALDGTVHLHCTDTAGEWMVAVDADGAYTVTPEHGKGSAAVRGPAHDLLMVLWRRLPLDAVEVIGDRSVAERLVARTNLD